MNDYREKLKGIVEGSNRIVFFGGAGVSTESGIPDFRSETGLYKAKAEFGYPPEYLISLTSFRRDPELFFSYYKANMLYPDAEPNPAHLALAKLESEGKLLSVVTQNIDGLHRKAGSKRVHELHGSVLRNICTGCGENYGLDYILNEKNCQGGDGNPTSVPKCKKCGGIVKPDVVLYEEALDTDVISAASADIRNADTLIIGGTSLVVYPAASYVNLFAGNNLVLINKGETGMDIRADLVIREPIGEVLSMFL